LPHTGGWLDQDSFIVYGMDVVISEIKAKQAQEQHQTELNANRGRR
jgi:hypothetical protein